MRGGIACPRPGRSHLHTATVPLSAIFLFLFLSALGLRPARRPRPPTLPPIPSIPYPIQFNASCVHLMWGRLPCLGTRAHQLDRSIGGCCDRRRATSRGGRAGVYALASTGVGRARQVLCSFVASTCLRPCCLRRVSRSGRAQAGLTGRRVCTQAPAQSLLAHLCCWSGALRQYSQAAVRR